ncbi:M56 family metallopeptidase [Nocardia grenadensis]|uniref:M56 family metallopeptidase n=1 Tax=Nocardia grenadensis TaxID=931537 RepID=UPI0007A38914|nr:M56 family metallopeptidase [Nocardia grenadensis]
MSALVIPAVLAFVLAASAIGGPALVRTAAPTLMRIPRTAVLVLTGSLLLWLLAVASLSLMAAWMVTGPRVLPAPVAEACRQCLDDASPFAPTTVSTDIPVVLLLLLPAVTLSTLVGLGVPRWVRRHRATRWAAQALAVRARTARVAGHRVLVIDDPRPVAFSLPRRYGGIVVSDGLCVSLEPSELAAVLEHERAHLRQHHHVMLTLVGGLTWSLRWVPLVAAIADAIPHYLEIAADNAARSHAGTPALASALLKLGAPDNHLTAAPGKPLTGLLLHAAGPDRIGHLVSPTRARSAVLPASTLAVQLLAFAAVVATVHGSYLFVVLSGCATAV